MAAKPEEIPQWAKERACELTNEQVGFAVYRVSNVGQSGYSVLSVLARYISKHEKPPADPDLEKAREICATVAEACGLESIAQEYREKEFDNDDEVEFVRMALKEARGEG